MTRPSTIKLPPMLIISLAVFCGCVMDAVIKVLTVETSVVMIITCRFIIGGAITTALYAAMRGPLPSWEAVRFHAMRSAIQVVAAFSFFFALTKLPLAEATVLGFTAALLIAPFASLILGERMSPLAIAAVGVGFIGAVVAVGGASPAGTPLDGDRLVGILAVAIAVVAYALVVVLLRMRAQKEDSLLIVVLSNVLPGIGLAVGMGLALLVLPADLRPTAPPVSAVPLLFGAAILAVTTWWLMTLAYARAEAQRLAPFEYTALIWAALFGWALFDEPVSWRLFAGAAIIIGACLMVAYETRFAARRATKMPASDILD